MSRHARHQSPKAHEPKAAPSLVDAPSIPADASNESDGVESTDEATASPAGTGDDVATVLVAVEPAQSFRLNGLGALHHNGVVYAPGDGLPFTSAQLAALGITHLAVEA